MAGFATRASFAGHPSRSATAGHALTFNQDHPMGAGQITFRENDKVHWRNRSCSDVLPRRSRALSLHRDTPIRTKSISQMNTARGRLSGSFIRCFENELIPLHRDYILGGTTPEDLLILAHTVQLSVLTRREQEIATLVGRGHSNKLIARQLGLSEGTVKAHVHRILQKLRFQNRIALIGALSIADEA
jgi:DNA-binding CsgD family transcriptional regulator